MRSQGYFSVVVFGANAVITAALRPLHAQSNILDNGISPPPEPEPIEVTELPLHPVTLDEREGRCTLEINPRGTGCIGVLPSLLSGNFLLDGIHVTASLKYVGASALSIYRGLQLIIVKADGKKFSNCDA